MGHRAPGKDLRGGPGFILLPPLSFHGQRPSEAQPHKNCLGAFPLTPTQNALDLSLTLLPASVLSCGSCGPLVSSAAHPGNSQPSLWRILSTIGGPPSI